MSFSCISQPDCWIMVSPTITFNQFPPSFLVMDVRGALGAGVGGNLSWDASWWCKQCHCLYVITLDDIDGSDYFDFFFNWNVTRLYLTTNCYRKWINTLWPIIFKNSTTLWCSLLINQHWKHIIGDLLRFALKFQNTEISLHKCNNHYKNSSTISANTWLPNTL